ncbi:hypothetical protein BCR32DRAFT_249451 [Anaeromyces robustus]|uniref:Bulb-type lectin domain-containing protein n=1 Tax=Anaeromyces robustus TaxID=1754192 RepID=A0A1Y1WPX6_9FUNG|nr:hypothetical protein BCR32DRAFT_249451 [Anaeromyces robustus]|eukprot:ORX75597.1 hypothetical protein BCR32DRAFT_249451 [Anaeromyces robustus]
MKYSKILLLFTTILCCNKVNTKAAYEPTIDDFKTTLKEYYKEFSNKLECIPLNSINPAYNPYHSSLINFESSNNNYHNIVPIVGIPYKNSDNSDVDNPCGVVKNQGGSSITCNLTFKSDINDFIYISGKTNTTDTIKLNDDKLLKFYNTYFNSGNNFNGHIHHYIELSEYISDDSISWSSSKNDTNALENLLNIFRNLPNYEKKFSHIEDTLKGEALLNNISINNIYESTNWFNNSRIFDGYIMGHLETLNEETYPSDAISKSYTSPFSNKFGWLNGNYSNPYIFGHSNTKKYNNELSYEEAINKSAQKMLQINKYDIDRSYSSEVTFHIPDNRCWNLTAIPIYEAEVNIWACGQYNLNGNFVINREKEFDITYKKSIHPVRFLQFLNVPTKCDSGNPKENRNIEKILKNYNPFYSNVLNSIDKTKNNNLGSGEYLKVNEGITSSNGKFIFGLLETGELVLRENNKDGRKLWSNGVILPTTQKDGKKLNYGFKLRVGENGHLMVTANHNIFENYNLPYNVGFPDGIGYTLYIDEEDHIPFVNLYDGIGIKILEIKPDNRYKGYAFPREYNIPLAFDLPENKFDIYHDHNKEMVEDIYKNSLAMNGTTIIKENEALVSSNGKYKFYLQSTGNMVIKEGSRTMWSSNTANVESFESPYKLLLNSTGEFILYDKNDFALWQVSNGSFYGNELAREKNTKLMSFNLTLSDEGELYVEDENHNKSWSTWSVLEEVNHTHIRYLKPNHKVEIYTPNTNTTQPVPEPKPETKTVYIYNKKLDKCLISGSKFTYRPQIGKCNNKNAKWVISVSGEGFIKSSSKEWCLNVANINIGTVTMRECDDNAIFNPIKGSVKSVLSDNKCLGLLVSNGTKLNMNNCDSSKDDQQWEVRTSIKMN